MDTNRYFIGLSLPAGLSSEISRLQHSVYDPNIMLSPLVPHITLLPPGALSSSHPMHFLPRVRSEASSRLPLNVSLTGGGMFDQRVYYADVECPGLHQLHEALAALLPAKSRASYLVGRGFTPHLTLAQAKPLKTLPGRLVADLSEELSKIVPRSFDVRHVSVFTRKGPRDYGMRPI